MKWWIISGSLLQKSCSLLKLYYPSFCMQIFIASVISRCKSIGEKSHQNHVSILNYKKHALDDGELAVCIIEGK